MKRNAINLLTAAIGALALATLCGTVRADLVGGTYVTQTLPSPTAWPTNWPGAVTNVPPQAYSLADSSLTGFTGQGQPSSTGGANTCASETFTPLRPFQLAGISIVGSANAVVSATMHLYDVTTNLTSNNGTIYNGSGATYGPPSTLPTDLLGNGSGISFTTATSGQLFWFFGLTNGPSGNDMVFLNTNHTYALEFSVAAADQNNFIWYRNSVADPGGQGMGSHDIVNSNRLTLSSLGLAGGAPRTFAVALYSTNFVPLGAQTNPANIVLNPVPAQYGPPTVWPYTAGMAIPTDGTYTDEPFGTNTIMGETFRPTRDCMLRNFYLTCSATTNSGNYVLALYDLGTGGTTTYGSSFVPSSNVNLLSHPNQVFPLYWSFSPKTFNITNDTIAKIKFTLQDQITLTNGHDYFLGLIYGGGGSNDLVLKRTTSGSTYANGAAFKGLLTGARNDGFGGTVRNFVMAIDVPNPNVAITVTSAALNTSWPIVAGMGAPVQATFDDPQTALDEQASPTPTAVRMDVALGRTLSMGFIATNSYNLGAIALRQNGIGSSNVLFNLSVWDITNSFFTATNTIEKWPRNFQPDIDSSPKGIPVFGTNINFYYTAANGANGVGQGTNAQFLILNIDQDYHVPIVSNHIYMVEISAETLGENASQIGMFQWVRSSYETYYQIELFPDLGDGIQYDGLRTNAASANTGIDILPRMLQRTFDDPETYAGNVVGTAVREAAVAMYAGAAPTVPAPVLYTNVSHSGSSTVLTWTSKAGASYSVLRTNNLSAPLSTWPAIVTGYTAGASSLSYTDTTATASQNFYRVRSP
jgi:hypothetical protein